MVSSHTLKKTYAPLGISLNLEEKLGTNSFEGETM